MGQAGLWVLLSDYVAEDQRVKLLVLSDLHLEAGKPVVLPPASSFDVAVLAGDITTPGREAVAWAHQSFGILARPSVLVAGNHEFYGAPDLETELAAMAQLAHGSQVHLLNRRSVVIDGVRFVGCTLWTDFQLPVAVGAQRETDVQLALRTANTMMADYQLIQLLAPAVRASRYREVARLLRAEDTLAMHWIDRDWLRRELQKPFAGPTVVITHHAPSAESVASHYEGDRLTPAFVSDLPDEFFDVPCAWIHGHTHSSANYVRGRCLVFSNPRGYPLAGGELENASFKPGLIVELATS